MRRCMVYKIDNHNGERLESYEAYFHAWSTDYEEFENGPGHVPVAIVEDKDGRINIVYAGHIRFLAPWGQEKEKE